VNKPGQKDNSTFDRKVALRAKMLMQVPKPVILETHGGLGKIYQVCYRHVVDGVVFEADSVKAGALAMQRATWSVYEADCERALMAGVGSHLEVNYLDMDPYGEPWPAMEAFFASERPFARRMVIVVNDGLRQKLKMNAGWSVASKQEATARYGNGALYQKYLEICREMVGEIAATVGYQMEGWTGYYCGFGNNMAHYAAVLARK
jgi:hypothetical protein